VRINLFKQTNPNDTFANPNDTFASEWYTCLNNAYDKGV